MNALYIVLHCKKYEREQDEKEMEEKGEREREQKILLPL